MILEYHFSQWDEKLETLLVANLWRCMRKVKLLRMSPGHRLCATHRLVRSKDWSVDNAKEEQEDACPMYQCRASGSEDSSCLQAVIASSGKLQDNDQSNRFLHFLLSIRSLAHSFATG